MDKLQFLVLIYRKVRFYTRDAMLACVATSYGPVSVSVCHKSVYLQ